MNPFLIIEIEGIFFSLFALLYLFFVKQAAVHQTRIIQFLLIDNIGILTGDIVVSTYEGVTTSSAWWFTRVFCLLVYIMQFLMLMVMATFMYRAVAEGSGKPNKSFIAVVHFNCVIVIVLALLTPMFGFLYRIDELNHHLRGPLYAPAMVLSGIAIITTGIMLLKHRACLSKLDFYTFLAFLILPFVGIIMQMITSGGQYLNISLTGVVLVIIISVLYQGKQRTVNLEAKLMENRVYLLNSQIKPHFLFNSLSVIRALIDDSPEDAKEAIGHLSKLLRQGLNFDKRTDTISIGQEISYVRDYLYMEKLRYGDRLKVIYDIDPEEEFQIPFLSIQPLVENAIKHGIKQKEEGGLLIICVFREDNNHIVEVIDDGTGFDVEKMKEQAIQRKAAGSDNGVGIVNVEERLKLMCKGRIEYYTTPGKGTTARIVIPL